MSTYDSWKTRSPDDERAGEEQEIARICKGLGITTVVIDDELRQCDCCGKMRHDIITVWASHVGETAACPKCRGWTEED